MNGGGIYTPQPMAKNTYLEILIYSALFLSPLLHTSVEDSALTRTMWSGFFLISAALIIFFASYHFRVQRIFVRIATLIGLSGASAFILGTYPARPFAFFFICIAALLIYSLQIFPKKKLGIIMLCCITLYAQWGIAQFVLQRDLGLFKIGESVLNQSTPGVASFYIQGEKIIRAYGPFAHANSFGGVMLLGIILLLISKKNTANPLWEQSVMTILTLALILSFSRAAIIGGVIAYAIFYRRLYWKKIIPIGIIVLLCLPLFLLRSFDSHGVALADRSTGASWYLNMFDTQTFIRGFGIGNYSYSLQTYLAEHSIAHDPWDVAPIHSVPLFLIAEYGIILSSFIFIFLFRFIRKYKAWYLVALIPSIALDHYFATQFSPLVFLILTSHVAIS